MGQEVNRFPEGGLIDRVDKHISRLAFKASLPAPVEALVSIPGAWYGCLPYALGLTPVLLSAFSERHTVRAQQVGGVALTAGVGWWLRQAYVSTQTGRGFILFYGMVASKAKLLAVPHVGIGIAKLAGLDTHAAALYTTSYFIVQGLIEMFKGLVWRLRPVASLEEELSTVPRHITELGALTKRPDQANLSFPSGDAAGGCAFGMTIALFAPEFRTQAAAWASMVLFGRMYFHAHHFLDVLVGGALGAGTVLAVHRCGKPNWAHALGGQLWLLAVWPLLQNLKPRKKS